MVAWCQCTAIDERDRRAIREDSSSAVLDVDNTQIDRIHQDAFIRGAVGRILYRGEELMFTLEGSELSAETYLPGQRLRLAELVVGIEVKLVLRQVVRTGGTKREVYSDRIVALVDSAADRE